jgi:hypothetical protein
MIYNTDISVEEIIKNSVQEAKLGEQKKRRSRIYKLLDFYSGNNIDKYVGEFFEAQAFREIPPYNTNITKRFINKLSKIYTLGAKRKVNSVYDSLTIKKDARMTHLERMTRLLGTVATQIVFKENYGKPCFEYRPVYYFDVFLADPFTPKAIMYPLLMNTDDVNLVNECEYAYWDEERYIHYDEDGNILQEYEHGYGILPFLFTHRNEQLDSFFVEGANDICGANLQANITLTELQLGLRSQMFGQAYTTGVYSDKPIERIGSDKILDLPEGATFNIVSPGGDPISAIEAVKFQIDLVAQNNHLYVQFAQDGGETPSGIALQIKSIDLHESYVDDKKIWLMYEHELYEIEKTIAAYNNIKLPEKMGVDFNEIEYPKTVQDQIAWHSFMLENNLTSLPELYVKYNNDYDKKEAIKIIEENMELNGAKEEPTEQEPANNITGSIFNQARQRATNN